jgi:SSS family solute:Na+ symporter
VPSSALVLGVVLLYLGACLAVGLWPGRKASKTADGFVAGDRSLGLVLLYFITGATIFSSFAFLGGPGWAYSRGAAAFYILGYGALGFMPFYFLGPRAARVGRRYGFVTQAEMAAARFRSPALAAVMAVVSVVALVPYLAVQMKGAGIVLSAVTRGAVPGWAGAAAVYLVVLVYVWRSGVLGVGWTNTFQGLFMMGLAWGLGLYLPHRLHGGVGAMFDRLAESRPELLLAPGLASGGAPWTWGEYSTAVIMSIVGFSVWPHLFMKAFTARSVRTIRRTVVLYPTFQIFLVPLFLIGFSGVFFESPPPQADQILPHLLMSMEIPALLVGLFCAGALAASMSSGDAMAHAAASIVVRDGLMAAGGRRLDTREQRRLIRWLVVAVLVLAYGVAVGSGATLVSLLLYAYGPVAQLAPVIVAALYWPRARGAGAVAGLVAGAVVTVLLSAWPELRPWPVHAGIYGLAANLALLVGVSLAWGRGPTAADRDFLSAAAGKASS